MNPLLSCQSLTKSFGGRPLFQNITLGILPGDRLGIIGPNGSGKSTLLRIIAGIEPTDSGEISRRRDLRLVYVPQSEAFAPEASIESILDSAAETLPLQEHEWIAKKGRIVAQTGITDLSQKAGQLSGGWRKRLAIANALLQEPDVLLLDEPTNHLDLEGVVWLENLLKSAPFAVAVITHDRYFLENVASRMIELNRAYPEGYLEAVGTYSDLLAKKEDLLAGQIHKQHALGGKVKREIEWLRRGPQARTTKAQARIDQAHRMMGELAELKARNSEVRSADMEFAASRRQTRELLSAKGVSKSLGGRLLFQNVDVVLAPSMRLGLIGTNGSGKTTLLKVLLGELQPDGGEIRRAERLRYLRFDQHRAALNPTVSLRRTLAPEQDDIEVHGSWMHVSAWARRFLFRPEQLEMPVGSLSGGEQARVLLANLMRQPADIIILDEPTNDLDIPTLEVLEESLLEFPGAIVLVTHDRYLLDSISTEVLALDGEGGVHSLADYTQWEAIQSRKAKPAAPPPPAKTKTPTAPRRLSTQEQKELAGMEAKIMDAEGELEAMQAELANPSLAANHEAMQAHWAKIQQHQDKIASLYTRWEELEARKG